MLFGALLEEMVALMRQFIDLASIGRLALTCLAGSNLAEGLLRDTWKQHIEQWSRGRISAMVTEAGKWILKDLDPSTLRKLLSGLQLTGCSVKAEKEVQDIKEGPDSEEAITLQVEELSLAFTLPCQESWANKSTTTPYKWAVSWVNIPDLEGLTGNFSCVPLFEDPPAQNKIHKANWKGLSEEEEKAKAEVLCKRINQQNRSVRGSWELKRWPGLRKTAEGWRRAAGIPVKDLSWIDCARAVCAGIWILTQDHPANVGHWIVPLVMFTLKLELDSLARGSHKPHQFNSATAVAGLKSHRAKIDQSHAELDEYVNQMTQLAQQGDCEAVAFLSGLKQYRRRPRNIAIGWHERIEPSRRPAASQRPGYESA